MTEPVVDTPAESVPVYPSHHPSWGTWGEREITRFRFRAALFQRRGLSEPDAETLADRLAERDYERDDRRVCIECKHLQRSWHCFAAKQGWLAHIKAGSREADHYTPLQQTLQRCEGFEFQTP